MRSALLASRRIAATVLLSVGAAASAAPPSTTLRDYPGVSATMDIGEGSCPATIPVTIRANSADDIKQGSKALSKVMAWAQINAQMTCPQSTAIQITGLVNGTNVYKGLAQRADSWALAEVPATSSPPTAQAPQPPPAPIVIAKVPAAPTPPKEEPAPPARTSGAAMPSTALLTITQCDKLGAHPDDPEAVATGIGDKKLDAKAVIKACEAATKADPATPRLHFQLARGYLKADRLEDATEQLIPAAEEGHGGALAYLGDLHLSGAPGIEADPMLARTLYEKAVASGFEPAKKILAEFEDKTDEYAKAEAAETEAASVGGNAGAGSLKPYVMPGIMDNIYNRKFDAIEFNESWVKEYLFNIADNVRAICESNFTQKEVDRLKAEADADHFNIGQASAGASLMGGMAQLAQALKDPNAFMRQSASSAPGPNDDPFEAGMKDTEALFQRHLCKTPGLSQFAKNLKAYVQNDEAPLPAPNAIMNACLRDPPPSKYKASDFCLCFAGGLKAARVSQANRRDLTKDFRATATKLMNMDRNRGQFQACRSGF